MNDSKMTCDSARDLAAGYVIGALEPSEEAAVRDHLRTCPEPHAEFADLGGVVPYLVEADLELVEPPESLRDRIMAAAAADLAERPGSPATLSGDSPLAFSSVAEREAHAGRTRPRTSRLDWGLRIAAVLAIVAIGGWNLLLQSQVGALRDQVAGIETYQSAVAAVLDVAAQPGSQTAVLAPQTPGGPRGLAAIGSDGSIQFALQDLTPTSGSQVYETWAIVGESAPVPLGSFAVGPSGTASFTSRPGPTDPGVIVALSREPAPGATTPTEVVSVGIGTTPSS